MQFEQKSEGDELVTQVSRGQTYESEDTNANTICEGKTDIFQESKDGVKIMLDLLDQNKGLQ